MSEEDARQKPGLYGEYEIVERLAAIATFLQPISVLEQVGRIWFSAEVDAWVPRSSRSRRAALGI